ncbi:MAG: hypothetical protein KUF77_16605 [Candidatus Thiodiazotropha sp. (ex Lucina aurantia)]|nr:hypothetical protein [Candidatus Thiodiazotropha taylori]MBV2100385.1 hypothetical protein [Candidatus Thiodiazotropha sp. (ex Codakia orbicularis)]MBV2104647.1 hypothetical protein [Candidatus Thiodiazotropha sp. (ex Lucina aurantia)]MBV2119215.1 hypothetical protein [Candidatus Thiodiazotropha sp. (ex Lucina aurantia)]
MKYVEIELTQGNINNSHLYLSLIFEFFPSESIGGPNISEEAKMLLEVHSGLEKPVVTDIAEDKKIFRKRSWVREFFEVHSLKAGDKVIIEHTGGNRYHVYPARF